MPPNDERPGSSAAGPSTPPPAECSPSKVAEPGGRPDRATVLETLKTFFSPHLSAAEMNDLFGSLPPGTQEMFWRELRRRIDRERK
jgi:hypothetical protein